MSNSKGYCIELTKGGTAWLVLSQEAISDKEVLLHICSIEGQKKSIKVQRLELPKIEGEIVSLEKYFQPVKNCPICKSPAEDAKEVFSVVQLYWYVDVLQCKLCGCVYKSLVPSKEFLKYIYGQNYVHHLQQDCGKPNRIYQSRLARMGQPKGRHLDYGCGAGFFTKAALHAGWDSYGADPYLPEYLRKGEFRDRFFRLDAKYGMNRLREEIGAFDCITMWSVVEHLTEPMKVFKSLAHALRPGGIIVFNCPYGGSRLARSSGKNWYMAVLLEHLLFLTFNSIGWLSKELGFGVQKVRISGTPYPFGKSKIDIRSQGLSKLPMKVYCLEKDIYKAEKEQEKIIQQDLKSWLIRWALRHAQGENDKIAAIIRWVTNMLSIGDHVEAILIKK